jgi:hypothetical protein
MNKLAGTEESTPRNGTKHECQQQQDMCLENCQSEVKRQHSQQLEHDDHYGVAASSKDDTEEFASGTLVQKNCLHTETDSDVLWSAYENQVHCCLLHSNQNASMCPHDHH